MARKPSSPSPRKPRGLPVHRVPDLSAPSLIDPALPFPPPAPDPVLPAIIDNCTDEQRAVRECGEAANTLIRDQGIYDALYTMITLRRGYAIAYREFQEIMERRRSAREEKGESWNPLVEDFLIQYAMFAASQQFTEHDFMHGVTNTLLPWMTEVIDRHTRADEQEVREEAEGDERRRREAPLPIGFKHSPHQEEPSLSRDGSLVLAGWGPAVLYLLDQACSHLQSHNRTYMILRLVTTAPRGTDQKADLAVFGRSLWEGCCNTEKRLAVFTAVCVDSRLSRPPDLLVVDNLALAHTAGFAGRPPGASAGDAHKRLRKWCTRAGAGLLAAVPLDDNERPDLTSPEWEQLRAFGGLTPVEVYAHEDRYRIVVGNQAATLEVERGALDSRGPRLVVTG